MQNQAEELEIALKEVGTIKPHWEEDVQAFVFEHPAYPVRYAGDTEQEVIKNYPLYLSDFIEERLKGNLAPFVERLTSGRGGKRPNAGRPKGKSKEETKMVRLPIRIADWIKESPEHLEAVRNLMAN